MAQPATPDPSLWDQFLQAMIAIGHWFSDKFSQFMHWAFPNFMEFHDSAAKVHQSHDLYYYLSLEWLRDFLSFVFAKLWLAVAVIFSGDYGKIWHDSVVYYDHLSTAAKVAAWIGFIFAIYATYFWGRFFYFFFKRRISKLRYGLHYAKYRYGTYFAIFRPQTYVVPDHLIERWSINDPNHGVMKRVIELFTINLAITLVISGVIAICFILGAYVIHYVGLIPLAFYPLVIPAAIWLFREIKCLDHDGTLVFSMAYIMAFGYLLAVDFDLGFHGYIINAVSYLLGFSQPIDFDPIVYTIFLYLAVITLVRYMLFYIYIEPMKVKRYKARGIDVVARYNQKIQEKAQLQKNKVSRRRIFR